MPKKILGFLALPAALAIAGAALPLACGSDNPPVVSLGGGCLINSDCDDPLVCAFRLCHTQCQTDRDCSQGQLCVIAERPDRVCQLASEKSCHYNSDCPGVEVCGVDDQCRDQCSVDRDCVPGQLCVTGTCADQSELVDGGLREVDGGQAIGQPCSYTSECPDPLVCRDGFCAYECLGPRDCPATMECQADHRCKQPDGGAFCVPGEIFFCGCPGGGQGKQTCSLDGKSVGPCMDCQDGG
jgi:hypothetical protein